MAEIVARPTFPLPTPGPWSVPFTRLGVRPLRAGTTVHRAGGRLGDTSEYPDKNKPGWFFVIKERPGEPRFGLDIERNGDLNVWNDLAWSDVLPEGSGTFIQINDATPAFPLVEPVAEEVSEKHEQWVDDANVQWNRDASSADIAYVLYQVPVLIAVHASEMLPK